LFAANSSTPGYLATVHTVNAFLASQVYRNTDRTPLMNTHAFINGVPSLPIGRTTLTEL